MQDLNPNTQCSELGQVILKESCLIDEFTLFMERQNIYVQNTNMETTFTNGCQEDLKIG